MPASQTRSRPHERATINYYQVLNVPYTATKTDIARAYRALIRHAHPDRFMDDAARRKAEERAKLLNAAYTVLSKPELRREHDQVIRKQAVDEALFARYTGNSPGYGEHPAYRPPSPRVTKQPPSPEMVRAQRRAYRSATLQLVVTIIIFTLGLALAVVAGSLLMQGFHAVFS